jgi:hypothetical protein
VSKAVLHHIAKIADEAGYEVMGVDGILGILYNRESVPDELLLALTADDVDNLYDSFVGKAVDAIEDSLLTAEVLK